MSDRVTVTVDLKKASNWTTIMEISNKINESLNFIHQSCFFNKQISDDWEYASIQIGETSTSRALEIP